MAKGCISLDRILDKLDGYLHKNDYTSAERHLRYWLAETESVGDVIFSKHFDLFVDDQ